MIDWVRHEPLYKCTPWQDNLKIQNTTNEYISYDYTFTTAVMRRIKGGGGGGGGEEEEEAHKINHTCIQIRHIK